MNVKNYLLIGIASCSFLGMKTDQTDASSYYPIKHYHSYTPRSWRGSYYTTSGDTLKVNTYSVSYNGKTLYKSNWSGWHKLAFAKVDSTNYTFNTLAKYGYQSSRRWHVKYKNGKKELINSQIMGVVIVWHKYSPAVKYKFRTADNIDFFYNTWRPAYLDIGSDGADLYNSYEDAKKEENPVTTFSDFRKEVSARWLKQNQQDNILKLRIDGTVYYENNDYHDIRPYNAYKSNGSIWSNFKPTSKYALLKRGTYIYKGTKWIYFYNDTDNKTYKYNGSHWKLEY